VEVVSVSDDVADELLALAHPEHNNSDEGERARSRTTAPTIPRSSITMKIEYTVRCDMCGYERTVDTESKAEDLEQKHCLTSLWCSFHRTEIKPDYEGKYEV
jgi:hypothetical protein